MRHIPQRFGPVDRVGESLEFVLNLLIATSSYRSHAKAPSLRSERIASAAVMTRCKPSQIVFA
ncbi:hypothetical protein, partial [Paraburkholderia aspalathi]|uniref:hypothetical protein n=1 Tax=Paraburkholderia aspalathi TaxID=1324617 RepID=UPI001BA72C8B